MKLRAPHGLDCRRDLRASKAKGGGGPCCDDRYPYPVRGGLKSIKVISWLPLFRHP